MTDMKTSKSKINEQVVVSKGELEAYLRKYPTHEARLKEYILIHINQIKEGVSAGYLSEEILKYSR